MKEQLYKTLADERGLETVQFIAMGAIVLALIGTIYGALNGSGQLRSAVRGTLTHYAARFGRDVHVNGPCRPSGGAITTRPGARSCGANPTQIVVFDQSTGSVVITQPDLSEPVVVRPVPGQRIIFDPQTHLVTLHEPQQQRIILFDPTAWQAVAVNPTTKAETPLQISLFQATETIEVHFLPMLAQQSTTIKSIWVAVPVISVPTLLSPSG